MGLVLVYDGNVVRDGYLLLWAIWCSWWPQAPGGHVSMGIRLVCCLNLVFDGYYELLWIAWYGVVAWNVKATSWNIAEIGWPLINELVCHINHRRSRRLMPF